MIYLNCIKYRKEVFKMRAALIGYGTMGRLVYEELGSECAVVIAPNGPDCMNNLLNMKNQLILLLIFCTGKPKYDL